MGWEVRTWLGHDWGLWLSVLGLDRDWSARADGVSGRGGPRSGVVCVAGVVVLEAGDAGAAQLT
jgi:hypothetical protein